MCYPPTLPPPPPLPLLQAIAAVLGLDSVYAASATRVIRRRVHSVVDDIVGCCMPEVLRCLPVYLNARLQAFTAPPHAPALHRDGSGGAGAGGAGAGVATTNHPYHPHLPPPPTASECHLLAGVQLCVERGHRRDVDVLGSLFVDHVRAGFQAVLTAWRAVGPVEFLHRLARLRRECIRIGTTDLYV